MAGIHHIDNRLILTFTISPDQDRLFRVRRFRGLQRLDQLSQIELSIFDRNPPRPVNRDNQRVRRTAHRLQRGGGWEFNIKLLILRFLCKPSANHEEDNQQKNDVDHRRQI